MRTEQRPDVLLVLPPTYHSGRLADYNPKEPMGLMYLAAELRQRGVTVEILDADLSSLTIEETVGEIVARGAAVTGFSVLQRALPSLELIVSGIRERGYLGHVCCGGVGATLAAESIMRRLPGVDSVVLGEGELTFADLVGQVLDRGDWRRVAGLCVRAAGGTVATGRPQKPDLDRLARPSRDLLGECLGRTGYATIASSRGCYAACTFCSNSGFERVSCGPGWRGRDPVSVADELELLYREYGARAVKFNDPNLFGPGRRGREHVLQLCAEIVRRQMNGLSLMAFTRASDLDPESCVALRQAGFERILIGIESACPEIIGAFRKGETLEEMEYGITCLREAGMTIVPGFMIFSPYTTLDTLVRDLDFLDRHAFRPTLSKSVRVFEGTELVRLLDAESRLIRRDPFEGYHEYRMRGDVATVYAALKAVAVDWIATLSARYQGDFWRLKKGQDFNGRQGFYSLQDAVYGIESRLLRSLVAWVRDDEFDRHDVVRELARTREALGDIESLYAGRSFWMLSEGVVRGFGLRTMADRLMHLFAERPYDTFPERYRWAND
ncbi:B12-binding domain-containing radical SAM protein [Patescibacteria group bacterium]